MKRQTGGMEGGREKEKYARKHKEEVERGRERKEGREGGMMGKRRGVHSSDTGSHLSQLLSDTRVVSVLVMESVLRSLGVVAVMFWYEMLKRRPTPLPPWKKPAER